MGNFIFCAVNHHKNLTIESESERYQDHRNYCRNFDFWLIVRKIIHLRRRWVTPQNFCLTLINLKKNYFLKKLLRWTNKNVRILIFKMLSLQTPGDTIILHMCTKNLDMIYSSWDIECTDETEIVNYESFFAILPPPPPAPLTTRKILKKWNMHLEMSPFYTCIPKINHMMYASWDMEHDRENSLSFRTIFCSFSP